MATKRKIREEETAEDIKKKRARRADRLSDLPEETKADRLSDLPEALQLHILASLNAKDIVQTSVWSTSWVSLWTRIPVLKFNSSAFNNLGMFDEFVYDVLHRRDHSATLERLDFNRSETCSTELLKRVFYYAFLFGVKQLEVYIEYEDSRTGTWPICQLCSFDSLTGLKLQSQSDMNCPFLGPISTSFKNLTVLHLKSALITDPDAFSGFPVLETLTLIDCELCLESTESKTLNVHALRLLNLTISSHESIECWELKTPKLRFFELLGPEIPLLRTHQGLPVLETVIIDSYGDYYHLRKQKQMFENLMSLFSTLYNVKSLTLFSSIVYLLSLFPHELARGSSPFGELKDLKLDFTYLHNENWFRNTPGRLFEPFEVFDVKAYLLHNSPDIKYTFTPGDSNSIRCMRSVG